jgi:homoserine kinase type II
MLWESTDPADALKKRFGFPSAASAASWVAGTLSAAWGVSVDRCDRIVISGWNAMAWVSSGEQRLIVKWSALPNLFARLKDVSAVTVWLHEQDIPVAMPVAALDGRRVLEVGNEARGRLRSKLTLPGSRFLVGVLPVLEGHLLDVDDGREVVDAGRMLASVHDALARYAGSVHGRRAGEGDQLVHNDYRSANLLHDGGRITAVLDLEEITYNTRVADLAKAAVMLGTRYRHWTPTTPEVRSAFIESYATCSPLSPEGRRELDARISEVLAADFWKRHANMK